VVWSFRRTRPRTERPRRPWSSTGGALAALTRAAAIQSDQIQLAASAWTDHNLVFTNPTGGPLNPQWLRARFRKMLERADVTPIKLHGLHHTQATVMLADGAHPKLVQERLRHSRIGVTMDTYSHIMPTLRSDTAARVDRLFGSQKNGNSLEKWLEEPETGLNQPNGGSDLELGFAGGDGRIRTADRGFAAGSSWAAHPKPSRWLIGNGPCGGRSRLRSPS
jgi:Phage integrase family